MILNLVDFLWKFLKFDGGFKLIGYLIEMKEKSKFYWSKCGEIKLIVIKFIVEKLVFDKEYIF